MNNAFVIETEEQSKDVDVRLGMRENELVRLIEAIRVVRASDGWSTLKKYVFTGVLESLEKKLVTEASKMPLNEKEIYSLQGQIGWAKKYADLDILAQTFRTELINVRLKLNPPTER